MDREPPSDTLCDRCRDFNPSKDKFVTKSDTHVGLPGILGFDYDATGLASWELGFLDEIYRRRGTCSLCWLIFKTTHYSDHGSIGYDGVEKDGGRVPCHVEWQIDGRMLDAQDVAHATTRRLRVFNPQGLFPDSHIMLLDGESPAQNPTISFLAREIKTPQVDIGRLSKWLDLCTTHHGGTCGLTTTLPSVKLSHVRFIDVRDNCLVHRVDIKAETFRYATLSYVWGMSPFLKLLSINIDEFSTPGFFDRQAHALPRTLRDAIQLVRSLGFRYIWIDALCIIQDGTADWKYVSSIMDRIYANGTLTVCCATGFDCESGLPGTSNTARNILQPIIYVQGMRLVAAVTVEGLIGQSKWDTRAWTFQERMLSRRCLIFVDNRVFFQCRQATWTEEVNSECSTPAWTLDMVKSPLRPSHQNPVRLYTDYVELYSGRNTTFLSDRLVAFSGLASVLCPPLKASLIFGLPNSYFDFALLWDKKASGKRMGTDSNSFRVLLPSWSWCGWTGAATWRISMISSSLTHLHQWLTDHTWIVWYAAWDINGEPRHAGEVSLQPPALLPELALVWRPTSDTVSQQHYGYPSARWMGYSETSAKPFGRHFASTSCIYDLTNNLPTRPTSTHLSGHLLYFWTWTAFFQLSRKSLSTQAFSTSLENGLHRFGIADLKGDWCGTIVLEDSWFNKVGGIFEFVALSEAREFSMEELDAWNYYIPEEREASEWYVFYALMIVWDEQHTVAERVGIAKIYQRAFLAGSFQPGQAWREIVLG